ncbi:MAG: T9SS type A sorting domain-containing protein [Ignavibacteria bacterium]|nr:T9SS type A sorting domain-containing protein [Ignavibacteria bacterium]MBT8380822.1 T9SS type A sorting domain-containing protein [Ignavibacteria bacterium]MBT8391210.1 T9SS type A sorting domain-containing protein [Ignavibacteria bacterium]NNL22142.1 T9SS type A sorting domain-containing protein [Ignavibacteriaceae bacterium]
MDGTPPSTKTDLISEILDFFNVIVPVELVSFTASKDEKDIVLNWSTATELNNQGFEIQRSSDNQNFNRIGFVEGKGTTTEKQDYFFRDNTHTVEGKYYYRLKQIDQDGSNNYSEVIEIEYNWLPTEFSLSQNYPNPFNPSTKIEFTVPVTFSGAQELLITIKIYDILGNEVVTLVNEEKPVGFYEVEFNASEYSSGFYFYTLKAGNFIQTKKMLLIK